MTKRARQRWDQAVLDKIGNRWTSPAAIERETGKGYVETQAQLRLLVEDGLIQEEIRGGRVRRTSRKPGRPKGSTGYKLKGPAVERQPFDMAPDVDNFLQDQYEPVSTAVVAGSVWCPLEQALEALCQLAKTGRAVQVETDLWVGG